MISPAGFRALLLGLGWILAIGLLLTEAVRAPLEPDEWQHLTVTADLRRGIREYADSWDNHTHLMHRLLAPGIDPDRVDRTRVVAARVGTVLATSGTAALVVTIALQLGSSAAVAALAGLMFLLSGPALAYGFQVRPDAFAGLCTAGALALLARREAGGPGAAARPFLSGVLAAVACAFSIKASLVITGLVLGLAAGWRPEPRRTAHELGWFGAGLLGGAFGWWLAGVPTASRPAFLATVLHGNLSGAEGRFRASLPFEHVPLLLAAAAGGCLAVLRRVGPGRARALVLAATAVPLGLYLAVVPAPYPQTLMLCAPGCALLAALLVGSLAAPGRGPRAWLALLLVIVVVAPAVRRAGRRVQRFPEQQERFREIREVEALVPAGTRVLSGYGFAYSRPHALPSGALVKEFQQLLAAPDRLAREVARLESDPPALVWWDERLERIGGSLEAFIRDRYRPIRPGSRLMVPAGRDS